MVSNDPSPVKTGKSESASVVNRRTTHDLILGGPGSIGIIDPSAIPAELLDLRQWVCWQFVTRNGRKTKLPFVARTTRGNRSPADTTNPATWATFDDAFASASDPTNKLNGVGFVFAPDGPYAGIDFDNCLDDRGEVLPWAKPYVDRLIGYGEISPSNRGLKFFCRGDAPEGKGRKLPKLGDDKKGAIEFYSRGRYFTVTGRVFGPDHAEIGNGAKVLAELHAEWFPPKGSYRKIEPSPSSLGDAEVIAKARKARNGGDKFSALFDGITDGYQSKSEADLALCSALAFWTGGDVGAIDRLSRQSRLFDDNWEARDDYRDRTIAKACDRTKSYDPNYRSVRTTTGKRESRSDLKVFDGPEPEKCGPTTRPSIEVSTERHTVHAEALKALESDPQIFRRGPSLVRVVREKQSETRLTVSSIMRNIEGSPRILELSDAVIGTRLTEFAEFFQLKNDKNGEPITVRAHPPDWLIKSIATLGHWPTFRRLTSVVECPFPRPDGSIVETPGYDRETSTLYMPARSFPKVPENPTREDARSAWERLKWYVRQFPFKSEDDRIIFLAGILNVIGRTAVDGPVMGIAVIGNKAGTGKGLLIDAMTLPAIGRPAPTTNYPEEKEEANKVKVAIVLSGKPVVNFDNLMEGSTYGGSVIDSALTAYTIDERILGASKNTGDLTVRTTWFLSGNNINPSSDAYRRWMVCNLETDLESPEHRDDIEDTKLRSVILENRGEMVRDALTILRAHALAGWPNGGWSPVGSFEEWDRIVRGAVWFATDRDCLTTLKNTANESPDRLAKVALLEGWRELPGGKTGHGGLTTVEALKLVNDTPSGYETLRIALIQRGRGGNLPDSRVLGNILRGMKNSLIGGYRLKEDGQRHKTTCWSVEQVSQPDPAETDAEVWPEGRE